MKASILFPYVVLLALACGAATARDFSLKSGSAAIDRSMILPNVTDGFSVSAPDLGALEHGQPPPPYGPRP